MTTNKLDPALISEAPNRRYSWADRAVAYHLVDQDRQDGWFTKCRLPIKVGARVGDRWPGGLSLCDRCRQATL